MSPTTVVERLGEGFAAGLPELLAREGPLREWLAIHADAKGASFLYEAWLNRRGDSDLVREPLREWIAVNGQKTVASFAYAAWLAAGGEHELVREPIRGWPLSVRR
jgi:hypothetical protein